MVCSPSWTRNATARRGCRAPQSAVCSRCSEGNGSMPAAPDGRTGPSPSQTSRRSRSPTMLNISCGFDAGAIEVLAAERADNLRVSIRADPHADFRQWFYFRLQGARGQQCNICFANAGQCTYVDGWMDYRAVASYDRQRWFRVPTSFDGTEMIVAHVPERDSIWYAYFEPYSWERHLDLLGRADSSPLARVRRLGGTLDGRDLDLVTVGEPAPGNRSLWLIARQHPG